MTSSSTTVVSLVMVEAHRRDCGPVELGLCDESVHDHASVKQWSLLLFVPYQRADSGVPLAAGAPGDHAVRGIVVYYESIK